MLGKNKPRELKAKSLEDSVDAYFSADVETDGPGTIFYAEVQTRACREVIAGDSGKDVWPCLQRGWPLKGARLLALCLGHNVIERPLTTLAAAAREG
jgi:hypothetical protein